MSTHQPYGEYECPRKGCDRSRHIQGTGSGVLIPPACVAHYPDIVRFEKV